MGEGEINPICHYRKSRHSEPEAGTEPRPYVSPTLHPQPSTLNPPPLGTLTISCHSLERPETKDQRLARGVPSMPVSPDPIAVETQLPEPPPRIGAIDSETQAKRAAVESARVLEAELTARINGEVRFD